MEGSKITGIKDLDKLILFNMDTRTFLNTYRIKNRYIHSLFDENVFRKRVEKEFSRLVDSKHIKSWKEYYFDLVQWSNLLKEDYNFESNDFRDHPKKYYSIISRYFEAYLRKEKYTSYKDANRTLYAASESGYIDLIKFVIDNGADNYQGGMNAAAFGSHIETFEYFRKNIPFEYDLNEALGAAQDNPDNPEMIEHIQTLIKNS